MDWQVEDDPLDAFMAEINQEVKADKPAAVKPKGDLELDEEDNVADYMEVRCCECGLGTC